jgi:hypothetical protein
MRDEAEAMALGLTSAFFTVADAVAWADALIARVDAPPAEICDVALSSHRPAQDVARLLRSTPGRPDVAMVWRLLFSAMLTAIRRNEAGAGIVAAALRNLGNSEYEVPRDLHRQAFAVLYRRDSLDGEPDVSRARREAVDALVALLASRAGSPVDDWAPGSPR